jgi:hypothetical protein
LRIFFERAARIFGFRTGNVTLHPAFDGGFDGRHNPGEGELIARVGGGVGHF